MDTTRASSEDLTEATDDGTDAAGDLDGAFAELRGQLEDATKAARDNEEAVKDMTDAHRTGADLALDLTEAQFRVQDATDDAKSALDEHGESSRQFREASINLVREMTKVAEIQVEQARTAAEAEGATLSAAEAIDIENASLLTQAATLEGPQREAVLDHIARINDIPPEVQSEIQALIDEGKLAEADQLLKDTSATREATIVAEAETADADAKLEALTNKERTAKIRAIPTGSPLAMQAMAASGFQNESGGPIPGPKGKPVAGIAHGGEFVLSADVVDSIKRGGKTKGLGSKAAGGAPAMASGRDAPLMHVENMTINNGSDAEALAQMLNSRLVVS